MTDLQIFSFFILPAALAFGGWAYGAYSMRKLRERRRHVHAGRSK
jgi:hypothetical protein